MQASVSGLFHVRGRATIASEDHVRASSTPSPKRLFNSGGATAQALPRMPPPPRSSRCSRGFAPRATSSLPRHQAWVPLCFLHSGCNVNAGMAEGQCWKKLLRRNEFGSHWCSMTYVMWFYFCLQVIGGSSPASEAF